MHEGWNVLWLFPEILLSGATYSKDVQTDYKKFWERYTCWLTQLVFPDENLYILEND